MKQSNAKSNVIEMSQYRKTEVNESAVLIQNLGQVLQAVVREHGAKITLDAVQGMIQDIAKQVRTEKQPVSKRDKAVSNG